MVENAQTLWYTCRKNVSQRGGAHMQQAGADSRREKALVLGLPGE